MELAYFLGDFEDLYGQLSSWDDDYDTSRSTGGYIILFQGGPIDHSSNMPIPVSMISAEAEYNHSCLVCMATGNLHMTLNHIEGVNEVPVAN